MPMTKNKFEMIINYFDINEEYYEFKSIQEQMDFWTYVGKPFTKNSEVSKEMIEVAERWCFFEKYFDVTLN
jgi:hypothetical protein